jgi:hypothetical protein
VRTEESIHEEAEAQNTIKLLPLLNNGNGNGSGPGGPAAA